MATDEDFYQWLISKESWNESDRMATIKIEIDYKGDKRLDSAERIGSIEHPLFEQYQKIRTDFLGEFAFKDWCKSKSIKISYQGEKIGYKPDVGDFISIKNIVQQSEFRPSDLFACEVTHEQIDKAADIYVFSKEYYEATMRFSSIYIVGWMNKEEFRKIARYIKPGTLHGGKPLQYPKWVVGIGKLNNLYSLTSKLR